MHAADAALREMQLREPDRAWIVVFVPAARSPLKANGPRASDAARLAMTRSALRDAKMEGGELGRRAIVWDDEIRRAKISVARKNEPTPFPLPLEGSVRRAPSPSYTIDTVRRLREALVNRGCTRVRVRLLIGADQAAQFHRWRSHRSLVRLAEPLVLLRPPVRTRADLARVLRESGTWSVNDIEQWLQRTVPMRTNAMSSTAIRRTLAQARAGAPSDASLSPSVAAYIRSHGLYAEETEVPVRKPARARQQSGDLA
jgi:nicotinic acid mononucleotide adenylyltransferase